MSEPGWYSDPHGQAGLRWWDGLQWTGHVRDSADDRPGATHVPAPHVPAWQTPPAPRPEAGAGTAPAVARVLDTFSRGLRLYADDQVVGCGNASLAWTQIEWVAYWAAPAVSYGGGPGLQWIFQAGRHPFQGGPRVEAVTEDEATWTQLVRLCRRLAEPRLVAELAGRVRGGDAVDVGQGLTVHPGGIRGGRVSLGWSAVAGATVRDGRVWIHQPAGSAAALFVPQQNPNAVLLPELLAELKGGGSAGHL